MRKIAIASVLVIGGLVAGLTPVANACPNTGTTPAQLTEVQAEVSIICLVNRRRAKHHLHAVRGNPQLWSAAQSHSDSMGSKNYFSHFGDGTPETRAAAAGYMSGGGIWGIGENIAWGSGGMGRPGSIVAAWMASPVHRTVMLSPQYRQIGVGATEASPMGADDGKSMIYTALFGVHHH